MTSGLIIGPDPRYPPDVDEDGMWLDEWVDEDGDRWLRDSGLQWFCMSELEREREALVERQQVILDVAEAQWRLDGTVPDGVVVRKRRSGEVGFVLVPRVAPVAASGARRTALTG